MAARAIVGIALGILFVPVIWMLLISITVSGYVAFWFWSLFQGNFNNFLLMYVTGGMQSMSAPIMPGLSFPHSLIEGFGTDSFFTGFLHTYLAALVTWTIIGAWAGAIERSAVRGIGVGAGIWLGWLIIEMIYELALGSFSFFLTLLVAQLLTVIVVIVVAAIFGAMTKSSEES